MLLAKAIIDDGFNPEIVRGADFDGMLEIPRIAAHSNLVLPKRMIPFSQIARSKDFSEAVCFYEHDRHFADILRDPDKYVEVLRKFPLVISPDCSLYCDMPLTAQIANVYRNRAIGSYLQRQGLTVIANIHWSDADSYTHNVLNERFAFLGAPVNSVVSVGTYGCLKNKKTKQLFIAGFEVMLEELRPVTVLIYGAMPEKLFGRYRKFTNLVHYRDFISVVRGGGYGL